MLLWSSICLVGLIACALVPSLVDLLTFETYPFNWVGRQWANKRKKEKNEYTIKDEAFEGFIKTKIISIIKWMNNEQNT